MRRTGRVSLCVQELHHPPNFPWILAAIPESQNHHSLFQLLHSSAPLPCKSDRKHGRVKQLLSTLTRIQSVSRMARCACITMRNNQPWTNVSQDEAIPHLISHGATHILKLFPPSAVWVVQLAPNWLLGLFRYCAIVCVPRDVSMLMTMTNVADMKISQIAFTVTSSGHASQLCLPTSESTHAFSYDTNEPLVHVLITQPTHLSWLPTWDRWCFGVCAKPSSSEQRQSK